MIKNFYVYRKQFPLILTYAVTIHKCQGLSLDCAIVDLSCEVFSDGMAYVALSRVRSLALLLRMRKACISFCLCAVACLQDTAGPSTEDMSESATSSEHPGSSTTGVSAGTSTETAGSTSSGSAADGRSVSPNQGAVVAAF